MENIVRKDFLNAGILGDGAGVPTNRGFRSVRTEHIQSPAYSERYLETFPTVWAAAYAFERNLEFEEQTLSAGGETLQPATEEWASLFLLHYYGLIHLTEYNRNELLREYDKDLWNALSGTYPDANTDVSHIRLLETNNHTVVGAYYSSVIFFSGRDRAAWADDKIINSFLNGTRLSWELCSNQLLRTEDEKKGFHLHLRRVIRLLSNYEITNRLRQFCESQFGEPGEIPDALDKNPMNWVDIPGNTPYDTNEYLKRYPLYKRNNEAGRTFYLVAGLPTTPWMTVAILPGCAPYNYQKVGDKVISVPFRGKRIMCKLEEKDRIVMLKDLFLADAPYWCKVPKNSNFYTSKIRSLHQVELRDPALTNNESAICLAPIRRELLEHFPELFASPNPGSAAPHLQRSSLEWTFHILGKEIKWDCRPALATELPSTSLALWPPKVSSKWKLYVAYGTGNKESCGRWHLIDETGAQGNCLELNESTGEYVTILQGPGVSNRPKALMVTDHQEKERGILFISALEEQTVNITTPASLSVDFGTSNTCIAYKKTSSSILKFKLSPEMIWGEPSEVEMPGFVPFRWGAGKGFYPTVLLSRRGDRQIEELMADEIQVEHLFKVDLPGLHSEIEERLLQGRLNTFWEPHMNMKWNLDDPTPWRSLFLGLSLLYAHAELFFDGSQGATINKYIFTYPLAFTETDRNAFHVEAKQIIQKIRQYCYGTDPLADPYTYDDEIDESTAVASSAWVEPVPTTMEVFVDIGGGTSDIAIRHNESYLVLDSVKVAGNTFFRFAKKNFDADLALKGAPEFKRDLWRVLFGQPEKEFELNEDTFDFSTYYSLAINRLNEDTFKKREAKIVQDSKGTASFQRYRTRLFFRHIMAYSLLQACAAAINNRLNLEDGIKLILSGNAWGLMLFADLPRSSKKLGEEASTILDLLKRHLMNSLKDEEKPYLEKLRISRVDLLNENDLSKAKTGVALGALIADGGMKKDSEAIRPFAGLTVRGLSLNRFDPIDILWSERWGFDEFRRKLGPIDEITDVKIKDPKSLKQPLDSVLSVFTSIGNVSRNDQDNMPAATWLDINAVLCRKIARLEGSKLNGAPINQFLSFVLYPQDSQRDFLDTLAEENGCYKK